MKKEKRFDVIYKGTTSGMLSQKILIDKETGVNYLFVSEGYAGGLTVLVGSDGKPIVSPVSTMPGEL